MRDASSVSLTMERHQNSQILNICQILRRCPFNKGKNEKKMNISELFGFWRFLEGCAPAFRLVLVSDVQEVGGRGSRLSRPPMSLLTSKHQINDMLANRKQRRHSMWSSMEAPPPLLPKGMTRGFH
jgi:hypothetical protein